MNIFRLDNNPNAAAQAMVDKHVIKMILESAQLLSTAHRVLDNYSGDLLYKATHVNHPSAKWVRESVCNYVWVYVHFCALIDEYKYRYGGKYHKCERLREILAKPPVNIPSGIETKAPSVMDEQYIIGDDVVENYRNYYRLGKTSLHKWTRREPPEWMHLTKS